MIRKIGIFTGSRGEWGYLRPILMKIKKNNLKYELIISNMHLLSDKGFSYKEIEKDGFKISNKIFMNINGPDEISWPKSLGLLSFQLPDILNKLNIDILLLAGDRAETLVAAQAAYYSDIPIAHIQAGELSGHKDGMARHAIGKLAHIHFSSNEDASERLKKFGEQRFRIHQVGAPQIDDIKNQKKYSLSKLKKILNISLKKKFCLCIVHPTSENIQECISYVNMINNVTKSLNYVQIWIYPNNDVGGKKISAQIDSINHNDAFIFRNLNRLVFLSLLKNASFIVGNSSAGILEAPSLKTASINLGLRQKNRLRAKTVIDIENVSENKIKRAIHRIKNANYKKILKNATNPYGDGKSANRIIKVLERIKLDLKLRNKIIEE